MDFSDEEEAVRKHGRGRKKHAEEVSGVSPRKRKLKFSQEEGGGASVVKPAPKERYVRRGGNKAIASYPIDEEEEEEPVPSVPKPAPRERYQSQSQRYRPYRAPSEEERDESEEEYPSPVKPAPKARYRRKSGPSASEPEQGVDEEKEEELPLPVPKPAPQARYQSQRNSSSASVPIIKEAEQRQGKHDEDEVFFASPSTPSSSWGGGKSRVSRPSAGKEDFYRTLLEQEGDSVVLASDR